jgi:hypothetical protein
MRSHGDCFVNTVRALLSQAIVLSGRDHTPEQLARLVSHTGSQLKQFLRFVVYARAKKRATLEKLIDSHARQSVAGSVLHDFHVLSKAYNVAKHDIFNWPTSDVLDLLQAANRSAHALVAQGLGSGV